MFLIMGQNQGKMGQQQSKDELLYQSVISGNVNAIEALQSQGANLESIDQKGRTPLILACLNPELVEVAKILIQLEANINAYRAGRHGGTPLHHAAKRGLETNVKLLLSHGANPLVNNDECQTPLDVARIRGHANVVRAIENHICYFSGWVREFHGLGILEAFAPQFLSRKIWVVVTPRGSSNHLKPPRLELAIYPMLLDSQPHSLISLWKAKIDDPKFDQSDPVLTIYHHPTKTRYKLASESVGDKLQLQWLWNACRGIPQHTPALYNVQTSNETTPSHQLAAEGEESATLIDTDTEAINKGGWSYVLRPLRSEKSSYGWMDQLPKEDSNGWGLSTCKPLIKEQENEDYNGWGLPTSDPIGVEPAKEDCNGWGMPQSKQIGKGPIKDYNWWQSFTSESIGHEPAKEDANGWAALPSKPIGNRHTEDEYNGWSQPISKPIGNRTAKEDFNGWGTPAFKPTSDAPAIGQPTNAIDSLDSLTPSAPPIPDELLAEEGQIHYPPINLSPVQNNMSKPSMRSQTSMRSGGKDEGRSDSSSASSWCVICWEAAIEGACVPCGHMVGCMSCLTEIEVKKGVCPVCRMRIDKVLRLFSV